MKHLFSVILFCIIATTNAVGQQKISFTFYGTPIEVSSFSSTVKPLTSLDYDKIADTMESMSVSDIQRLQLECIQLKEKLTLNDWGYLELVNKAAHACLPNDNEAIMLAVLLMSYSGYKVKLAKAGSSLYLLFASNHTIYNSIFFKIDNISYYTYPILYDIKNKTVQVCPADFRGDKLVSLSLDQVPNFAQNSSVKRELKANRYPEWSFTISCNENLIDFYNNIPPSMLDGNLMTRWTQLANTPLSENVQRQLYPKMSQLVNGLSQHEAVERILNWIQTAFTYGDDIDNWGKDRAFYPEETLYYPYNDTEDRSALMSRIITDLLKLKTLFLYFPGHTAIGVAFTDEDVEGDYVMYEGQKYIICDGVYIGAYVGQARPGFKEPEKMFPVATVKHLLANINTPNENVKKRQEITPKPQPSPQPKQISTATIDWIDFAAKVNKKEYQLKVGIKSATKVEEVNIIVNGSQSRGINTVKSDGYDLTINRTLTLSEGYNSIVVNVRNADGVTTSEKMITCQVINPISVSKNKRIALVMGNSNYQDIDMRLRNPVNDATDLAAKLEALGFTVIRSLDQSRKGMETAIYEFGRKAQGYDVALFYYAGHGIGCNGSNYLVPIDADLPEEVSVQYNCTNSNLVLDLMEKAHCQMKIVILDACRNNPFARSWNRSISGDGLNIMNAPKGTFIAFSTAPGDVAQDGTGRNSPYTTALLQTLDIPNLSITDFFQEVLEKVATQTGERQNPWTSNSFRGKFYFNQSN